MVSDQHRNPLQLLSQIYYYKVAFLGLFDIFSQREVISRYPSYILSALGILPEGSPVFNWCVWSQLSSRLPLAGLGSWFVLPGMRDVTVNVSRQFSLKQLGILGSQWSQDPTVDPGRKGGMPVLTRSSHPGVRPSRQLRGKIPRVGTHYCDLCTESKCIIWGLKFFICFQRLIFIYFHTFETYMYQTGISTCICSSIWNGGFLPRWGQY